VRRPTRPRPVRISQFLSKQERPVAGAKISPWQVAYGRGSMGLGEPLQVPLQTDVEGKFRLVIPEDAPFIPTVKAYGIRSFAFHIDHPDYPVWSDYVPVDGERKIVLAEPATITIRVRSAEGGGVPPDLYPVPASSDWTEQDGVVTIRRVDLASPSASPWLRIVQAPEQGAPCFSDLINLRQYEGPAISLEVVLKPGVRVVGRLADNAPRPIANGRVLATIIAGGRANGRGWNWRVATDIDADGNFVFESLPQDETVQLIALCNGWVSASPTSSDVEAYGTAHGFATAPLDDKQMRAGNRVYPRLHHLTAPTIEPLIPMEATLACLVTVLDDNGLPIPDAKVSFSPNQYWFDGGSQLLGFESNSLDTMRAARDRAASAPFKFSWPKNRYSQPTNAAGMAMIGGLPFAHAPTATLTREYRFSVSHDKYQLAPDAAVQQLLPQQQLTVKIEPGQLGEITVRMLPK
jgi:hypothetical protein